MRSRLDFTTPGARGGQVREIRDAARADEATVILEGHPFAYTVRVADTDDGPQVIGLDIRSPEGEAVPITPNDLRRIPLARLAHAAMAIRTGEALALITEPGPTGFKNPEPRDGPPPKRPGRRGHPPEFYAQVAALWRAAHDPARNVRGLSVHRYVSAEMAKATGQRASENTVKSWLRRARELDLLTEESPREKG
ncbi:hypothetical protein IU443_07455 [Nocardia farcinica]|nr:hypothetical protein [Nocardia farcinica]MBF6262710.1 hypothetical protein [Nocardia farcinica]MBF6281214.1 hypothetical protein [Nocardia farcinica]MBF6305990.1 hypothetical protein [Nocardia farcinica]MBF6389782.1 hypothetical protein [Nocardia farcinica]MBF6565560.1 hypothetical protein [Nocardia farcinica]